VERLKKTAKNLGVSGKPVFTQTNYVQNGRQTGNGCSATVFNSGGIGREVTCRTQVSKS
jgi:hypothetical protein